MIPSFLPYIDEPNKIYIIGSRSSGKSSLFRLLFKQPYLDKIQPSVNGITKSVLNMNGKIFTVKDLTDSDDYKITKIFYNEIEDVICIIAVFSIIDHDSFDKAKSLLTYAQSNITNNVDIQMILCANKYDLIGEKNQGVPLEEVDDFVKTIHNCKFFLISCKTGLNVNEVVNAINELEVSPADDTNEERDRTNKNSCFVF